MYKVSADRVKCSFCGKELKCNLGTSSIRIHLKKHGAFDAKPTSTSAISKQQSDVQISSSTTAQFSSDRCEDEENNENEENSEFLTTDFDDIMECDNEKESSKENTTGSNKGSTFL